MKVAVTGGAGYIGSFAVKTLIGSGHDVTIIDNLEKGRRMHPKASFKRIDLRKGQGLDSALSEQDAVMHFAGYIDVKESVQHPERYFDNNLSAGLNLLEAMARQNVDTIVFSSTAAVYGSPKRVPIKEDDETKPINPYGASKLLFEKALALYEDRGIRAAVLRYFNVCGAADDGSMGEAHEPETHLIPNILRGARSGKPVSIFGDDYPTRDGTCVRDYVHVQDLIDAHIMALDSVKKKRRSATYNVGSQHGSSVREILAACEQTAGMKIPVRVMPRREGDPATLIASSARIRRELGWKPRHDLASITRSAWLWERRKGKR